MGCPQYYPKDGLSADEQVRMVKAGVSFCRMSDYFDDLKKYFSDRNKIVERCKAEGLCVTDKSDWTPAEIKSLARSRMSLARRELKLQLIPIIQQQAATDRVSVVEAVKQFRIGVYEYLLHVEQEPRRDFGKARKKPWAN
jgi:hypothetical protein